MESTIKTAQQLLAEESQLSPALRTILGVLIMLVQIMAGRLNLNSRNSSKPPSSNRFGNSGKGDKGGSGKKTGGQPGRIGATLEKIDNPDVIKPLTVDRSLLPPGEMTEDRIQGFISKLKKSGIDTQLIEYGDGHAGYIKRPEHDIKINNQSKDSKEKPDYQIRLNKKHDSNVQFDTLAHELAHLYLGHLGADKFLKTQDRQKKSHDTMELEAESVCYIVCYRNNVKPNSEAYLTNFIDDKLQADDMDLYALLKAAGQIETILDLVEHTSFKD